MCADRHAIDIGGFMLAARRGRSMVDLDPFITISKRT